MGHKAFKRAANLDAIWFTLPGPNDEEIRFDCEEDIAGGMILDFSGVMTGKGDVMQAVVDFFDNVIVEDQRARFWELIHDKKARIGLSMLIELSQWLAGEYSDRPTGQSSDITSPRISSGDGSTGGALHAVSTYSRPEPAAVST